MNNYIFIILFYYLIYFLSIPSHTSDLTSSSTPVSPDLPNLMVKSQLEYNIKTDVVFEVAAPLETCAKVGKLNSKFFSQLVVQKL